MLAKPVVDTNVVRGTVQVEVTVPGTVDSTWAALTTQETVGKWFGDLSQDLSPGAQVRLDFGDADFFEIENILLLPPAELRYSWRFLGTGPQDQIVWKIASRPEGSCSVTVTDSNTSRSVVVVEELSSGWTDFLGRLQQFLKSGNVTRYDWRRDFDGMIELPAPVERARSLLFLGDSQTKWLPFGEIPQTNRGTLQRMIRPSPDEVWVTGVEWKGAFEVLCQLRARKWIHETNCRIEIAPRETGSALIVRHTGWAEINEDPSYCMEERRKFGERWIVALQHALNLVASGSVPSH